MAICKSSVRISNILTISRELNIITVPFVVIVLGIGL